MLLYKVFNIFLFMFISLQVWAQDIPCLNSQDEWQEQCQRISQIHFNTGIIPSPEAILDLIKNRNGQQNGWHEKRDLFEYDMYFQLKESHPDSKNIGFISFIQKLLNSPEAVSILDSGAGHAVASREILAQSGQRKDVNIVGISLDAPKDDIYSLRKCQRMKIFDPEAQLKNVPMPIIKQLQNLEKTDPRFHYFLGNLLKFVAQWPGYKGQFKLITDIFGPLSYSQDISSILRAYGELLKENGRVYIATRGHNQQEKFIGNYILKENQSGLPNLNGSLTIYQWLKQNIEFGKIKGLRILNPHSRHSRKDNELLEESIILERTSEKLDIPSLVLIQESPNFPPHRVFAPTEKPVLIRSKL